MRRILAIYNFCGGTGKTTLAMNLAHGLAQRGKRVALLDLDPQGSLTTFIGAIPYSLERGVSDLFTDGRTQTIIWEGVQVYPSTAAMIEAEDELMGERGGERVALFRRRVKAIEADAVVIDCPPSMGSLTNLALELADFVLAPLEPTYKGAVQTERFLRILASSARKGRWNGRVLAFVPSRANLRRDATKCALEDLEKNLSPIATVTAPIKDSAAVPKAARLHKPVGLIDASGDATQALAAVTALVAGAL